MTIGFGGFGGVPGAGRRTRIGRVGIGIADHHREPFRIRRPFITLQAAFQFSELISFAAAAIEQPDLTAAHAWFAR